MGEDERIRVNSVVQIAPLLELKREGRQWFGGCFLVVTEIKSWGVQGFVQSPGVEVLAYYRAKWEHVAYVGEAAWTLGEVK